MELRPYQQQDVAIIKRRNSLGIFNEQRTGKTPTALRAIVQMTQGKILIVSTASMVLKWEEEANTWTNRSVHVYTGTQSRRSKILDLWSNSPDHILIVSYDLFKSTKINRGLVDFIRKQAKPSGLIVDEIHRAVGRKTANFKSLRTLVKIPYRLYLTGTPAPNHPAQVWAILTMIDPQQFSSYWRFVEDFFVIEEQPLPSYVARNVGRSYAMQEGDFRHGKRDEYISLLNNHAIMRKRKDVMPWLPKQETPTRIRLEPTATQKKQLQELSEFFETGDVIVEGILDQMIRYRQICAAPEILGLKGKSPKIEWLKSYLQDYPDKQTIVFSRFTKFLKLTAKYLVGFDVGVVVGETPLKERKRLIDGFQSGRIDTLLIQIDAGKEGLTLDSADTMVFMDIYPPASDNLQARDRIVATHEDRNKPKEIIELCLKDTYDEELYDLVEKKVTLTDVANNYIKYIKERK